MEPNTLSYCPLLSIRLFIHACSLFFGRVASKTYVGSVIALASNYDFIFCLYKREIGVVANKLFTEVGEDVAVKEAPESFKV